MSRFTVSKLSLSRGEDINSKYDFKLCLIDHETTETVKGALQLKQLSLTVEEFFELRQVINREANNLIDTEKQLLKDQIEMFKTRTDQLTRQLEDLDNF